jgi:hypothetical protein
VNQPTAKKISIKMSLQAQTAPGCHGGNRHFTNAIFSRFLHVVEVTVDFIVADALQLQLVHSIS